MISIQEARRIVMDKAARLSGTERIPVVRAVGRVLAEDVRAGSDLPPFDRVTMDGFAVRSEDVARPGATLDVVGEVAAGDEGTQTLGSGQALEIMTGAPLPPGADAVIKVELTERQGDRVRFEASASAGLNVVSRGQDLRAGQVIARNGAAVSVPRLSLLIASGRGEVEVLRRPRVAVLTSGNELVPPGSSLQRGQIHESNGHSLVALFDLCGADVQDLGVAKDTREDMDGKFALTSAADIVVLTGGSSVGKYDLSDEVVEAAGGVRHFDRLAVKPGKPTLFYTRPGGQLVFCLPGNPVAALMTGRVLVTPAIAIAAGRDVHPWTPHRLPLAGEVPRHPRRDLLVPMRRATGSHGEALAFDGWHGSGDIVCMGRAAGFGLVARGEGAAMPGTPSDFFPLPGGTTW